MTPLVNIVSHKSEASYNARTAMRVGIVRFVYRKLDGTPRVAIGTTDETLIPADRLAKGANRRMPPNMVCYWDFNVQDWRSCKEERIEAVEGIIVNPMR